MNKRATPDEIKNQLADLTAQADTINAKEDKSEDDVNKLEELVSQIEALQNELKASQTEQRMIAAKARMEEPTRSAPMVRVAATAKKASGSELFSSWLRRDNTPESHYKARSAGIDLGSDRITIPVNYRNLNFKNRTIMSKGGTGSGLEWIFQSYSDKVSEYLSLTSPILGLVASETTSDGNNRTYFRVDDTSMEAAYTSASGGTETVPTIGDTNITSGNVVIGCFDLTSGYQKVSMNEIRDQHAAVNLEEKIAKASANSFARKMEREVFTATGNGTTGVQGIAQVASNYGNVTDWEVAYLEDFYFNFPAQYRQNAIFAMNTDTFGDVFANMKDSTGRSLFDKSNQGSEALEYDLMFGKKVVVSQYIADNTIYMFDPEGYQLRLVSGQELARFDEKFYPNVAWASVLSFGGAWVHDPSACWKITATTGSVD